MIAQFILATLSNMDEGRVKATRITPFEWSVHAVDSHCTVSTLYMYIQYAHNVWSE